MTDRKVPEYPYDRDDVPVKGYTRKRPSRNAKPDPEDGTGVEVANVAPQTGDRIIAVPPPGTVRKPTNGGVTILGGAAGGRREGVKRVGGK